MTKECRSEGISHALSGATAGADGGFHSAGTVATAEPKCSELSSEAAAADGTESPCILYVLVSMNGVDWEPAAGPPVTYFQPPPEPEAEPEPPDPKKGKAKKK